MSILTISVAMCVYNGVSFLEDQLKSIATQKHFPDELIICDDKSTDNSVNLINKLAQEIPFPVKLYQNDIKLGSTKNYEKAISLCSGDIIVLSDQDDVWLSSKLEIIYDMFSSSDDVVMMFSDALVVDDNLNTMGYNLWEVMKFTKRQQKFASNGNLYKVLLKHNVVTGATMAFRGSYKNHVLPIDPLWVHDSWIAFMLSNNNKTKLINNPLIMYRQHSSNQIGARRLTIIELIKRTINRIQNNFYCFQYELYNRAYLHIIKHNTSHTNSNELKLKVHHLKVRSGLLCRKSTIMHSITELLTLRYYRFSSGFVSFLEDLFSWVIYWYFPKILNK